MRIFWLVPLPMEKKPAPIPSTRFQRVLSETRCHKGGRLMKNPLTIIGILVGVGLTVIAGAAAAQPAGLFMIVNSGSGLCLEPNGSGFGRTDPATTL